MMVRQRLALVWVQAGVLSAHLYLLPVARLEAMKLLMTYVIKFQLRF
ncbi:hypothetical protein PS934_04871 [Pseudomonas fluorescens]|nr:hypothetical protein PS934_04871 [Pseudomonas fluorescens]